MANIIEIKNLVIERHESHLKLPRKPLFVFLEADITRAIGTAQIKKRDGIYLADITFSPIVEIKKIIYEELFPTLILQKQKPFPVGEIIGLALGIYPNVDETIGRISRQLEIGGAVANGEIFYTQKFINGKHEQRNFN